MNLIQASFILVAAFILTKDWVSAEEIPLSSVLRYGIKEFRIRTSDYKYAGTTGSLRIGVRQGKVECETSAETFSETSRTKLFVESDKSKFGSCKKALLRPKSSTPIQLRVLSDSGNPAYLDKVGMKMAGNGNWYDWEADREMVDKDTPTKWRTAYKSGYSGGEPIKGVAIDMSNVQFALTTGSLRIGVRQGPHTSCETEIELITAPKIGQHYTQFDKKKFGSCSYTKFNPKNSDKIQVRVLSNSPNKAYFEQVQVKLRGKWYGWARPEVMVELNNPTGWRNIN